MIDVSLNWCVFASGALVPVVEISVISEDFFKINK